VVGEEGLTLNEMVSQAQVLILAGSETTATLLCGLTYHLLKNPTTLDTLKTEIRSSFEDESELILNRLASLPYMNAVIEEALRMYPPVPNALPRVTPYPGAVICGKYVPGGTSVGLHHYSTYRCESNFSEPDSFIPERWLADTNGRFSGDDKTAFHPFSYGPRNCLGRKLVDPFIPLHLSWV
jgi:cytochrome P450